jgi:hypothetical protein
VSSIEQQRRDMIAACYSNPNWDGKDNSSKREEYLKKLNEHFNQAITAVYAPPDKKRDEQDVDWDNPFFAAHKREIEKTKAAMRLVLDDQGKTAGELLAGQEASDNGRGDFDQDVIPRNQ